MVFTFGTPEEGALEPVRLLVVAVATIGVVLGLAMAFNARDRRRAAVLARSWCLAPRELRDTIAIQAYGGLLPATSVVAVDMSWRCTPDEIWQAAARWRASLPPGVRLRVDGLIAAGLVARVTVDIAELPHPLAAPRIPGPADAPLKGRSSCWAWRAIMGRRVSKPGDTA